MNLTNADISLGNGGFTFDDFEEIILLAHLAVLPH